MAADGSIIIETKLDYSKAANQLTKLQNKVAEVDETLDSLGSGKSQLEEKSKALAGELDLAKKKLYEMQSAANGTYTSEQITTQVENVKQLQFQWDQTENAINRINKKIETSTQTLNKTKESAGEVERALAKADQELAEIRSSSVISSERIVSLKNELDDLITRKAKLEWAGVGIGHKEYDEISKRIAKINSQLDEYAGETKEAASGLDVFAKRFKTLLKRVFVFTVILSALRRIRAYLWDVIKTDSQASAAFAQLKGALLTLAQPIISVVVPAFTLLVHVLTAVVSQLARLVAMISGKSIDSAKKSAKALNDQTKALKGTGKAAKDAGKSLAAFDEINQLSDNSSSASGGGASSTDIAPDFSFLDGVDERLRKIANAVLLIGAGLALWKISSKLPGTLGEIGTKLAGMAIAIGGLMLMFDGLKDAWENGLDWTNLMEIIAGATALVGGLTIAFGKNGTAIGLVVAGLAALVTGFADAMENGVNLKNTLMVLAGIIATGLGIGMLTNNTLPALVAGIMAVLYAITVLVGNGDQLMQNFKEIFAGAAEFIDGLIHQDVNKMLNGLKKMVKGALNAVLTIVGSVVNLIIRGLNWLIDKINSISFSVPDWVPGIGGKSWSANIPHAAEWGIPQLAQGAVIPPNREFLAVLGDQKSGTNIEAPLETIVQAFRQALAEQGKDGSNRPIILMLDRRELGRAVVDVGNQENVRVGVSLT